MKLNLDRLSEYEKKYQNNQIALTALQQMVMSVVDSNLMNLPNNLALETLQDLKVIE